ncbi:hypothetical protein BAE44_0005846 [Dichanthelium oligosanthes]|uniref:Uncharacterized protein n=1 Tax=Dichanthelium oligosanthes TaxID=888268 RepID=A0A1E5W6V2_9POAL|nr:hypothetical protein BAE44_0005846 [Dichanthelium oligosanthes]
MREKGNEKTTPLSPLGMQPDEEIVLFHDAMSKRADTLAKIAEATNAKVRFDKLNKYMEYVDKVTSKFSAARLKMHEQILPELSKDLFPPLDD